MTIIQNDTAFVEGSRLYPQPASSGSLLYGKQSENPSPLIPTRWLPLDISSIDTVRMKYGPPEAYLQDAKVTLTFSLPFYVQENQLGIRIERTESLALARDEMNIEVGLITQDEALNAQILKDHFAQITHPKQFTITVPLFVCSFLGKPILDRIVTSGPKATHYSIKMNGLAPDGKRKCTYRVRLLINETENKIDCTYVGSSPIDTARMQDSWEHFKTWIKIKAGVIKDSIKKPQEAPRQPNVPLTQSQSQSQSFPHQSPSDFPGMQLDDQRAFVQPQNPTQN